MSHTPGPWRLTDNGGVIRRNRKDPDAKATHWWIRRADGCAIADTAYATEDDARLIAAAPDMLQALRDIVRQAGLVDRSSGETAVNLLQSIAEWGIAKATGGDE